MVFSRELKLTENLVVRSGNGLYAPASHRGVAVRERPNGHPPTGPETNRGVHMARRLISLTAVVALTLAAGVVTATGASAKAAPVDAHGSLHCSISGKIKFSPTPLTFGGPATPTTMSAKVKSGSCSGSSGVTSVKAKFTINLSSSDCTALALTNLPAATFGPGAKVKGAAKYNATTIHYAAGGTFTAASPITMNEPGVGSASVTGSFAGQHPTLHLVFDQDAQTLATNCTPKTKGLKGSGGLKKMSFNTQSFIDIPA
jgi:hypothetical protein